MKPTYLGVAGAVTKMLVAAQKNENLIFSRRPVIYEIRRRLKVLMLTETRTLLLMSMYQMSSEFTGPEEFPEMI
jgi:hypothetical protein